jgi:hypothetical protein
MSIKSAILDERFNRLNFTRGLGGGCCCRRLISALQRVEHRVGSSDHLSGLLQPFEHARLADGDGGTMNVDVVRSIVNVIKLFSPLLTTRPNKLQYLRVRPKTKVFHYGGDSLIRKYCTMLERLCDERQIPSSFGLRIGLEEKRIII